MSEPGTSSKKKTQRDKVTFPRIGASYRICEIGSAEDILGISRDKLAHRVMITGTHGITMQFNIFSLRSEKTWKISPKEFSSAVLYNQQIDSYVGIVNHVTLLHWSIDKSPFEENDKSIQLPKRADRIINNQNGQIFIIFETGQITSLDTILQGEYVERQGVNVPPSKIRDALAISDSAGRDCVLFATSFEKPERGTSSSSNEIRFYLTDVKDNETISRGSMNPVNLKHSAIGFCLQNNCLPIYLGSDLKIYQHQMKPEILPKMLTHLKDRPTLIRSTGDHVLICQQISDKISLKVYQTCDLDCAIYEREHKASFPHDIQIIDDNIFFIMRTEIMLFRLIRKFSVGKDIGLTSSGPFCSPCNVQFLAKESLKDHQNSSECKEYKPKCRSLQKLVL
ncbi:uncharacterized protein LOC118435884 [Folsomia candida]|uniref:uncharacterized protein LOC118435884 n=1 Tax=Folsomia candida TaxID=158441 RepID=UPI0016054CD0|nr:uncharacterized protein LOC118435884 [Folsomia candida]